MSFPAYLRFCCVNHENRSIGPHPSPSNFPDEMFVDLSVTGACLASSVISLIGVCYLLIPRHASDIDAQASHTRVLTGPALRKTITPLLIADILATSGVLLRSSVWLIQVWSSQHMRLNPSLRTFCVVSNIWIQYFYLCSYCWNIIHAVELLRSMCNWQERYLSRHFMGWMVPAVLVCAAGVLLYYPALNHCPKHHSMDVLVADLMLMAPLFLVFLINPILFCLAGRAARRLLIGTGGRFTANEREVLQSVHVKCKLIMVVFTVCWLPNIITLLLDLTRERRALFQLFEALWIIMAISNPMQALLNCLVLRGWPGFLTKCAADICGSWCSARKRATGLNINGHEGNTVTVFRKQSSSESEPILSFRRNPPMYT